MLVEYLVMRWWLSLINSQGLGKTIQMISFLAALEFSRKITRPILIVCPATLLRQWLEEFNDWWPPFQIIILHATGEVHKKVPDKDRRKSSGASVGPFSEKIKLFGKARTVFLTTFSGLQLNEKAFLNQPWEYVILDEGWCYCKLEKSKDTKSKIPIP